MIKIENSQQSAVSSNSNTPCIKTAHCPLPTGNYSRGFTLLEIIVSLGLFIVVMTIAMGAYATLIGLDRKARATNDVTASLSFVVDNMARSIRTGSGYHCGLSGGNGNCAQGGSDSFYFQDDASTPKTITYVRTNTTNGQHTIGSCEGSSPGACNDFTSTPLIDPRINITTLRFYVKGVGIADGQQPQVIISVTGTITPDAKTPPVTFTIETSATQRLIDI